MTGMSAVGFNPAAASPPPKTGPAASSIKFAASSRGSDGFTSSAGKTKSGFVLGGFGECCLGCVGGCIGLFLLAGMGLKKMLSGKWF